MIEVRGADPDRNLRPVDNVGVGVVRTVSHKDRNAAGVYGLSIDDRFQRGYLISGT